MKIPRDLKYTKTHEWLRINGAVIDVGITDFAQKQLSDITYVEFPAVDAAFHAREEVAVLESIKAAADIYAPVDGSIAETNSELETSPDLVNSDPYGEGWIFRMTPHDMADVEDLMEASEYEAFLAKESN